MTPSERMTDVQRQLAADNVRLVTYTINRYYPNSIPPAEWDDFVSIGYIALCRAAMLYNPDIGEFSTYAVNAIRKAIQREFKDRYREKRKHDTMVSLDEEFADDMSLSNVVTDDSPSVELMASLHIAMDDLKPIDRWILEQLLEGRLQQEIGNDIGFSLQRVNQRIKKIRSMLNNQIDTQRE